VQQLQKEGILLALPGTVGGTSGWYEFQDGEADMVARFDISPDGEWTLAEGPLTKKALQERKKAL
jgi:hypothetical protein